MDTNNLDGIDLLQVISITAALFIGFLPNIKSMRGTDKSITKFGYAMIILFGISLLTAFFSTVAKSSADKDDYKNLISQTSSTLEKASKNISMSDSILNLEGISVVKLKNLQTESFNILSKELLIALKTDSIQSKSEALNKKLIEEINIQKEITKASDSIIHRLKQERDISQRNNHLKLILCITALQSCQNIIYEGLQISKVDYTNLFESLNSNLKKKNLTEREVDSLLKVFHNLSSDISNTIGIYLGNTKKDIYYTISDTNKTTKAVKDFLDETVLLLNEQLSNNYLQSHQIIFNIWFDYYNTIYVQRSLFYLDKSTIGSVKQIKNLISNHNSFIKKILQNSDLKVQIESSFEK